MTHDEFIGGLAADADRIAHDALASGIPQPEFPVLLVCDAADALSRNPVLPKRTQAHRLGLLLRGLELRRDQLSPLAQVARGFPAHLRVTVANALPARARREVYGSERLAATPTEEEGADVLSPVVELRRDADGEPEAGQEQLGYSTVLLLSHPDHQGPNLRLLEDAELDPMVVGTLEELERVLATNRHVCGCAIDQSALVLLDAEDQKALLRRLAGYSTFLAIRVHDVAELQIAHGDASQIIKTTRQLGTPVPYDAISFRADRRIRAAELSFFRNSAELLQSHSTASLVLGDLNPTEAHLLVAATRARVRAGSLNPESASGPLTVSFLKGGLSGARLATVMCGGAPTFVAKITPKDQALEEMLRYRTFIRPWNDDLRPECHFHGDAAVILFSLVRGDDDPSIAAEPLADRLQQVWNKQWMRCDPAQVEAEEMFLAMALTRVANTLAELNKGAPAPDVSLPSSAVNPRVTRLDALEQEGFVWGLSDDAMRARRVAAERVRRNVTRSAVVHGDIHLRNILIRGESEIRLIDFVASGPGHPAVDLVRFELALYLGPVRQFEDEASSIAFQRALSIERASLEVLREDHPGFFQCHVNASCAAGMTAARDAALEVLRGHGGDCRDYLAMKFLVAWQHLGIIGSQTGLARAVIQATADTIVA